MQDFQSKLKGEQINEIKKKNVLYNFKCFLTDTPMKDTTDYTHYILAAICIHHKLKLVCRKLTFK